MKPIIRACAGAIVIITLAVSTVYFIRSCARIPGDEVLRVAEGIASHAERLLHLRPEVKIDRTTIIGPAHEALELITLKSDGEHAYSWTNTWAGSTKIIRLKGRFTASYGVNLREAPQFEINSKNLTVNVVLPEMRTELLAFEMRDWKLEEESSGWWNWLSTDDRNQVVQNMMTEARQDAQNSEILRRQSEDSLKAQLSELIQSAGGIPGEFHFSQPAPTPTM